MKCHVLSGRDYHTPHTVLSCSRWGNWQKQVKQKKAGLIAFIITQREKYKKPSCIAVKTCFTAAKRSCLFIWYRDLLRLRQRRRSRRRRSITEKASVCQLQVFVLCLISQWIMICTQVHSSHRVFVLLLSGTAVAFNWMWTLTFDWWELLPFSCPNIYKEERWKYPPPKKKMTLLSLTATSKTGSQIGRSPLTSAGEWGAIACVLHILPMMVV